MYIIIVIIKIIYFIKNRIYGYCGFINFYWCYYGINLLCKKYGVNKVNSVLETVRMGVKAVEQLGMVNGWDGKAKKAEALNYITKSLNAKGIKVKKSDLDMMIESVVAEFNKNRPA